MPDCPQFALLKNDDDPLPNAGTAHLFDLGCLYFTHSLAMPGKRSGAAEAASAARRLL
jgi:hypothetical protein